MPLRYLKTVLVVVGLCLLAAATNLIALGVAVAVQSTARPVGHRIVVDLLVSLLAIGVAVVLFSAWNRWLLRRQLPGLLGRTERPTPGALLAAVAVGAGLPVLVMVVFAVTGWGHWVWYGQVAWWVGLSAAFAGAVLPGVIEEVAYRWFLYGALKQRLPRWSAIAVVGLLFGTLHLNQVSTPTGAVTMLVAAQLVSLLFVAVYERTGSIWCAAIVHTLWDMSTGAAGFRFTNTFEQPSEWFHPVAGMIVDVPSRLLSGGEFGVDASLPAMLLYAVVGIWLLPRRSAAPEAIGPGRAAGSAG